MNNIIKKISSVTLAFLMLGTILPTVTIDNTVSARHKSSKNQAKKRRKNQAKNQAGAQHAPGKKSRKKGKNKGDKKISLENMIIKETTPNAPTNDEPVPPINDSKFLRFIDNNKKSITIGSCASGAASLALIIASCVHNIKNKSDKK